MSPELTVTMSTMHLYLHAVQLLLLGVAVAEPNPIHFPTNGANWYGIDGQWSTIAARVGNPAQFVNLIAGTSSSYTTIVGPKWCDQPTTDYECVERGSAFDFSKSTTWKEIGQYTLELSPELAEERFKTRVPDFGYGDFGRDTIKLQSIADNREVSTDGQVIASLNDTTQFLGMLGLSLGVRAFDTEELHPSYVESLYRNQEIPSRSWGYTAGNYHRVPKVPMDLVLGGTNQGRYESNDITWELDSNYKTYALLDAVTASATGNPPWGAGAKTLLLTPVNAKVDSSTPFLWLPEEACRSFEDSLGLVWNATTNLYLLSDDVHQNLVALNLSFNFTLAASAGSDQTVDISVPYSSLDLELMWPYIDNLNESQNYFPLKRATSDEQITLGRAFLQEAYMIFDFERNKFSVHQAIFPVGDDNIVPIQHPSNQTTPASKPVDSSAKKMPTAVIAGVAAGGVVVIIAVILAFVFCRRRKRPVPDTKPSQTVADPDTTYEVDGHSMIKLGPFSGATTLASPTRTEMAGDEPEIRRHELTAVNQEPAELIGSPMWEHDPNHSPWSPMSPLTPESERSIGYRRPVGS